MNGGSNLNHRLIACFDVKKMEYLVANLAFLSPEKLDKRERQG